MKSLNFRKLVKVEAGFQNYEWGKIGEASQVYQLAHISKQSIDPSKPYAELWMGTHTNCPSFVIGQDSQKMKLSELISSDLSYLGQNTNDLPFLFKVLSVGKALSIQAHPDKKLAEQLNEKFPTIYKDNNHKPEMAIALTNFEALCNFRKSNEIIEVLENVPEVSTLIGNDEAIREFKADPNKETLKTIFSSLFDVGVDQIKEQIHLLIERISKKEIACQRDKLVMKLNSQFPNDIGIFVSYFLNYFILYPGQSIVLDANEPHAYIEGDCIECMSSSDNVVRAGLTPKFKDKETLCSMLSYKMMDPHILKPQLIQESDDGREIIELYCPENYSEFRCIRVSLQSGGNSNSLNLKQAGILLTIKGEGVVQINNQEEEKVKIQRGDILFIGAGTSIDIVESNEFESFICFSEM